MPRNTDIKKMLIIGSGPIVIGQGSGFDYMGAQACKALREQGCEVVVVNPSPATIMTDLDIADRTYIEPLTVDSLKRIIEAEKPDALLATVGGQTAFNLAIFLEREGILKEHGVRLIGTDLPVIKKSEDRTAMEAIGVVTPAGRIARSMEEGMQVIKEIGFPAIVRTAYTVGGAGGGVTYNMEEFGEILAFALKTSPVRQVMIEKSYLGWKNIEFEVLRDSSGNTMVVAGTESIDPTGVHSGDSTTVYPIQTLRTEQIAGITELTKKIADAIGIVGSATIQYAINPESGDAIAVNISPRATRNSVLVSKSTGFPIATISAKLALGLTLDEVTINGKPALKYTAPKDYVAVKTSRFAFDKFPGANTTLSTSMKSVGEAIAFGQSFKESLQKAIRSLEIGRYGLGADGKDICSDENTIREMLTRPNPRRLFFIRCAITSGMSTQKIHELCGIDQWFIDSIRELVRFERKLQGKSVVSVPGEVMREAKQLGYSDAQLAKLLETDEDQVRLRRKVLGIQSDFASINEASFFSTYSNESTPENAEAGTGKKVLILGSGPNRIGQGAEIDYCCVHASVALMDEGYESVIINSNPEAVSTDPEMSTRLYIEPLTNEDVLDVIDREKPMGIIIQFGGRTSTNVAACLKKAGINVLGTPPISSDQARNRSAFGDTIRKIGLKQTEYDTASSEDDAIASANMIGYPVLVRPGRALDGQATQIVYDDDDMAAFVRKLAPPSVEKRLVIDKFLEGATKVDVEAIFDGKATVICGVMEHIEQAGVHSGDSACSIPPYSIPDVTINEIKRQTGLIAEELEVRGLMNAQFAVKDGDIYVLGANPQASRMLPFVMKATGIDWAGIAARVIMGKSLHEMGITEVTPKHISVKEAVFPFVRFPGVDVVLGPEMKSIGEVMGINTNFGNAYIKAEIAAGQDLPDKGTVFLSMANPDKAETAEIAVKLKELGFNIVATRGTASTIRAAGVNAQMVYKIGEGRPDATDFIKNEEIDLIINTPSGKKPRQHEISIRSAVVARGIPIITTVAGAKATVFGMETVRDHGSVIYSLQEYTR